MEYMEIPHIENGVTKIINIDWKRIPAFYETEDGGKIELSNGRVLIVSKSVYKVFYSYVSRFLAQPFLDQCK